MKDYKYALEIMQQELKNQFICPEVKYAFEASIEALEKQIPQRTDDITAVNKFGRCPICMNIVSPFRIKFCSECGQKLQWD